MNELSLLFMSDIKPANPEVVSLAVTCFGCKISEQGH